MAGIVPETGYVVFEWVYTGFRPFRHVNLFKVQATVQRFKKACLIRRYLQAKATQTWEADCVVYGGDTRVMRWIFESFGSSAV